MSRTSIGYADKYLEAAMTTRQLFLGGNDYVRWTWRKGTNGVAIYGVLLEPAATQICRYSRAHNSWALTRCTVPTTNATAPDGSATADVIHEDATAASTHYVQSVPTGALAGTTLYCLSTYFCSINRAFAGLYFDNGGAYILATFDLTTGEAAVSGTASLMAAWTEPFGDWWRCVARHRTVGAPGAGSAHVRVAEALDDTTFDGLNQDSLYVWGSQLEAGPFPSSQIINDGVASVTRNADSIIRHVNVLPCARQFCWALEVWIPTHTPTSDLKIASLNDGTVNNQVAMFVEASTGKFKVTSTVNGVVRGTLTINKVISNSNTYVLYVAIQQGQLYAAVYDNGVKTGSMLDSTTVDVAMNLQFADLQPFGGVAGEHKLYSPVDMRYPIVQRLPTLAELFKR